VPQLANVSITSVFAAQVMVATRAIKSSVQETAIATVTANVMTWVSVNAMMVLLEKHALLCARMAALAMEFAATEPVYASVVTADRLHLTARPNAVLRIAVGVELVSMANASVMLIRHLRIAVARVAQISTTATTVEFAMTANAHATTILWVLIVAKTAASHSTTATGQATVPMAHAHARTITVARPASGKIAPMTALVQASATL